MRRLEQFFEYGRSQLGARGATPEPDEQRAALSDPLHGKDGVNRPWPQPPSEAGWEHLPSHGSSPEVSVIIPTYNRRIQVCRAIESAPAQTMSNLEIIVIDDGSTDDTAVDVARFGKKVRYFYQPNCGVSAARNAGLRLARGRWIAPLDSDDIWDPTKLEKQLQALQAMGSGFGACFTNCTYAGDPDLTGTVFDLAGLATTEEYGEILNPIRYILGTNYALCLPSALIHRGVCSRVGGFDVDLGLAEDTEWKFRVFISTKVCYLRAPLVIGPDIPDPVGMLVFGQNQACEGGGLADEEEALQCGADDRGIEAGTGGGTGG